MAQENQGTTEVVDTPATEKQKIQKITDMEKEVQALEKQVKQLEKETAELESSNKGTKGKKAQFNLE